MLKKIVTISGRSGSGKTQLARYLRTKDITTFSISKIMTKTFEKMIQNFYTINEKKRQKEIIKIIKAKPNLPAKTIYNYVKDNLKNQKIIALDGVRSFNDFSKFSNVKIIKVYLHTDFPTRYKRVKNRDNQSLNFLLSRDKLDNKIGLTKLMENLDHLLFNHQNTSLKELHQQMDQVIKKKIFKL